MKTLYLVRHAKSSWAFSMSDHDRPLGPRGRRDLKKLSKFTSEQIPAPDLIITSTASRALYTALHFADHWNYPEEKIITDRRLFHASTGDIQKLLHEHHQENTLAIFGHNPGFTDFNNQMSHDPIDNIPTCGIMGIGFEIDSWRQFGQKRGKRLFFHAPKLLV
ncbi:histidine phosphatase family protein [Marinoscillum sp. MHG1-6]|uniref:SixA phosphatase family protein n=1 Tax=Marinoscillum sp. MHG1-6 TaxID=2959627 RepID=UPI0021588AE7|nr:histidine phosphatase family protein [Marinoscillum sp. MHG1-6]